MSKTETLRSLPPALAFFVEKELEAHRRAGRNLTVADVLKKNGFFSYVAAESAEASTSMQALRTYLPPNEQAAMGVCLLGIDNGVLRVAVGGRPRDSDVARIERAMVNGRVPYARIEFEPMNMADLMRLMRDQDEVPVERLHRVFLELSRDPDNAILIEQAFRDMVAEALQSRASDIHMVSHGDDTRCWIRYRVDGRMVCRYLLPANVMAPLLTRIKIESKMDAAERSRPQDGRIDFPWQQRQIDIRVAYIPVAPAGGEKITMRLLDSSSLRTFDTLFKDLPEIAARIRRTTHGHTKDGGLLLLSGPTGSGKSTTMFGIVQDVDRVTKQVYSVEAPVEYDMPLVDQMSVTDGGNITIADAVRALMRHDPDVIVIGEMRDHETIEAAMRAAETGHLVISTVHADDSIHTLERVQGFLRPDYKASGVYILGHSLIGVLSQRLVRTVCPVCRMRVDAHTALGSHDACQRIGIDPSTEVSVAAKDGCEICGNSGFHGRTLVLDALFPASNAEARRQMPEIIMSGNTALIAEMPGTFYMPRRQSVRDLLLKGLLDVNMALEMLENEGESSEISGAPVTPPPVFL